MLIYRLSACMTESKQDIFTSFLLQTARSTDQGPIELKGKVCWLDLGRISCRFGSIGHQCALLTERSKAPSGAGVAAALATGVTAAPLTHAGARDATAPG